MASCPITSWQINGETMERVSDFIFWGSKITIDDDYSHEIKRRLLLRRAMKELLKRAFKKSYKKSRQHIKKQGHYFANKGSV